MNNLSKGQVLICISGKKYNEWQNKHVNVKLTVGKEYIIDSVDREYFYIINNENVKNSYYHRRIGELFVLRDE